MTNRELIDEILTLIRSESNNNPAPLKCKIIRNYRDNPNLVDVKLEEGEIIQFVSVVGSNRIGNKAVLIFIDGSSDNMLVISPSGITDLIDIIYPIGAIYISANAVSPSILFGGEWEQIEDRFLLASGNTYIPSYDNQGFANKTGGASSVTLTADQSGLRAHGHGMSHNHGMAHTHRHRHTEQNKYSDGSGSASAYVYSSGRNAVDHYTSYDETASSKNTTDGASKTTTDDNTSSSAIEAHDNMPPYLVVNIWIRVK